MPLKGYRQTPEHRAKTITNMRKHVAHRWTEEERKTISARMIGNTNGKNNPGPIGRVRPQEERDAISRAHKGRPKSAETRARMSAGQKASWTKEKRARLSVSRKRHITESIGCMCGACKKPTSPTYIESILISFLSEFPEVIPEKQFGHYFVDAYLPPPYHLAFEADGEYWHKIGRKRDKKRDKWLYKNHNLVVIRLTSADLRAMSCFLPKGGIGVIPI